jgi:hypothetical protein
MARKTRLQRNLWWVRAAGTTVKAPETATISVKISIITASGSTQETEENGKLEASFSLYSSLAL